MIIVELVVIEKEVLKSNYKESDANIVELE